MVMDISIEAINDIPFAYTVRAGDHRILTVVTSSGQTLSKWLNQLLKKSTATILVGVSAECEYLEYTKRGVKEQPYDMVTLCAGSHCLIYHLDARETTYDSRDLTPHKSLGAFLENPRVVALGMEMEAVAVKMERDHGIKMKNAVDLRGMAVEGLEKKGEQLDLMRYDLDKLAKTVIGKHVDVVRPQEKVEWYSADNWERHFTMEKVQFATIDAYLCFLVGSQLYEMIHRDQTKFKNVKKNKNRLIRALLR